MDIFYYWKNYDEDLKTGRIGWLKSDRQKLRQLADRHPDSIWAFKTPAGEKGSLQLVAKLAWSDVARVATPKAESASTIHYDPNHPETLFYSMKATEPFVQEVSQFLRAQFPVAFRSNFQGDNGLQAMDGDFLRRFRKLISGFSPIALVELPAPAAIR
jgi:hypothetical protein